MSFNRSLPAVARLALAIAVVGLAPAAAGGAGGRLAPWFFPDDPILVDNDTAFDASQAQEVELSEAYDFLENTFASPGGQSSIRAANVNTVDDVPDSSWFTNRIGIRDLPLEEIARGPKKFARLDAEEWIVVRGKGPGGFQPGFRAVHPGDPKQIYQLEVDPHKHPQMATGAELVGTLIYHALGYHVSDIYMIRVDPSRIRIADDATIRDASGTRRFTRQDLDDILRGAARDAEGRVYMSADRFLEGKDLGEFKYYGTRSDDPNDIYPHEHRRELRANRVFAAWLAHDDSRAVNTLNMRVEAHGRKYIRHYMSDFGATLGSATRFGDAVTSGREYYLDKDASLRALLSFGFLLPPYLRADYPRRMPPAVGFFTSIGFEPARWKPNYPNPAFRNMRPDDAFWGAHLVSRFSDAVLRTIVEQVGYDDAEAVEYLTRTLIERRDRIARTWLTAVNPLRNFALTADGTLTFDNAAVMARAATPAASYRIRWFRFDNDSGRHEPAGEPTTVRQPVATAPLARFGSAAYVGVAVESEHPDYTTWRQPVRAYFRRVGTGWKTVGVFRHQDDGPGERGSPHPSRAPERQR